MVGSEADVYVYGFSSVDSDVAGDGPVVEALEGVVYSSRDNPGNNGGVLPSSRCIHRGLSFLFASLGLHIYTDFFLLSPSLGTCTPVPKSIFTYVCIFVCDRYSLM